MKQKSFIHKNSSVFFFLDNFSYLSNNKFWISDIKVIF